MRLTMMSAQGAIAQDLNDPAFSNRATGMPHRPSPDWLIVLRDGGLIAVAASAYVMILLRLNPRLAPTARF